MRTVSLRERAAELFPGLLGLWLALALLKFGNPVILDNQILAPANWAEAVYQSWPVAWAYGLFVAVAVCACLAYRHQRVESWWWVSLPAAWLAWQGLASLRTLRPDLTGVTVAHFAVCTLAYYLGYFVLRPGRSLRTFWFAVVGGWIAVVLIGWRQHFGGLAETRQFLYSLPNWRELPPELIAKVASNRIFSTLFYPNALAGAMLLFAPVMIAGAGILAAERKILTPSFQRAIFCFVPAAGAAGCLIWSGSKAGWLIAIGMMALTLVCQGFPQLGRPSTLSSRTTLILVLIIVIAGGGLGFWFRYGDYFARGATSASARFTYWSVAVSNTLARPILGSGPGTFMEVYRKGKPPQAEMSRLAHNDYLQQATDSGIPGALLFVVLVGGGVINGFPGSKAHPVRFAIWLGVVGLAIQSTVEFGLFIPALAWPWFVALGFLANRSKALQAQGKTVDKKTGSA